MDRTLLWLFSVHPTRPLSVISSSARSRSAFGSLLGHHSDCSCLGQGRVNKKQGRFSRTSELLTFSNVSRLPSIENTCIDERKLKAQLYVLDTLRSKSKEIMPRGQCTPSEVSCGWRTLLTYRGELWSVHLQ
ncbi:hypothetical protein E1B28_001669 [Marasmius oreades]|uniref:Uncharacterized protein n=1 Tax=Marasmius oreades TaxID=181124 RepID=A0A9P7V3X0_9AGAR|nr:uncharacterized protein E1B28_001669 [Marasmius oreades]KAG7099865.1 hypothetical protein E1B28_001669 [Marasmius oreades]